MACLLDQLEHSARQAIATDDDLATRVGQFEEYYCGEWKVIDMDVMIIGFARAGYSQVDGDRALNAIGHMMRRGMTISRGGRLYRWRRLIPR
jgi:hypothetical protein